MKKNLTLFVLVGILLLGAALRIYRLNAPSLRGDEAFTLIHWMQQPLAQTLDVIATVDPQGPISYALYRGWALIVGADEGTARILPALISLIGIAAIYGIGKRIGGRDVGLLAAALWAIHPYAIWHAQDARSYALWIAAGPLALWLALTALTRGRRADWIAYVAAGSIAAYIYYLEAFVIVAMNVYVFGRFRRDRPRLLRWIASQVLIAAIIAPWYLQERLLVRSGYGGTTDNFSTEGLFGKLLPELLFGETLSNQPAPIIGIAVIIVVALLIISRLPYRWLLVALVVIPVVGISLIATRLGVFASRYILSVSVILTVITSLLFFRFTNMSPILRSGLLLLVLLGGAVSLVNHFASHDYAKSPDWRELALALDAHVTNEAWVIQAAADEAFTFYCLERIQQATTCDDKLPANPVQSPTEIKSILTTRSDAYRSIWYVAKAPSDWANAQTVYAWLEANWQPIRTFDFRGLPALEYRPWSVERDAASITPIVTFGSIAHLSAIEISTDPNQMLTLILTWHAVSISEQPLKVFVHLLGDDEVIRTQSDQFPQDGRVATDTWESDRAYRDVYALSHAGLAAGDYTIAIGFYDPQSGQRLPVTIGEGDAVTDHYRIAITLP